MSIVFATNRARFPVISAAGGTIPFLEKDQGFSSNSYDLLFILRKRI
jgi:hypothetical protein